LGKAFALPTVALTAAAFPLLSMSAASAATGSYQADLGALNDSGATGTGMVTFDGDQATVTVEASGLLAGSPHAQHFHIGAEGVCPPASADADGDGIISTPEGQPFYGMIGTSLTTEGDTSPDSALAVERFPTAEGGSFTYERTFAVTPDVVSPFEAGTAVLVVHGIDPRWQRRLRRRRHEPAERGPAARGHGPGRLRCLRRIPDGPDARRRR
jgi:hypothetical protein